ncbi:MAG: class I SAM-dependent methyltransferase [Acidobacteriota bacterium]
MSRRQHGLDHYFRLMDAYGAARVYDTALQIGLLDALGREPRTPADLAGELGLQAAPLAGVLEVLQVLGLVEPEGDGFVLGDLGERLAAGPYRRLGGEFWDHLPVLLRTGEPLVQADAAAAGEAFYATQAASLGWMLAPAADLAARRLRVGDELRAPAILDLGAGSAVWSLAMASHDPAARVVAVDRPAVLSVATRRAASLGLEGQLAVRPGDYHQVSLEPQGYDLAVLGNVTHLEDYEGLRSLLRRVREALRSGGRAVIFDIFPRSPEGALSGALYGLGLALRTQQGRVHSETELAALLAECGFGPARLTDLPVPPQAVGMLVAEKS